MRVCFSVENMQERVRFSGHQINRRYSVLTYPPPPVSGFEKEPDHTQPQSGSRISPAVLFVIVILAVLFFISGILHLLVRFLTKNPPPSQSNRNPEVSNSEVLQRQLQQLFNLHDSGLDQAFIDTLPVFSYKEVVGPTEPFDCAVCLCEFLETDQLRLLPMCSHAFHISCIDTWLLSNSTCPLCRGPLSSSGFSIENPIFDYDDFREEDENPNRGEDLFSAAHKRVEIEGVLNVRLGKFRKLDASLGMGDNIGETSSSRLDTRRCYSMGSYQYVVGDANLRVALTLSQDGAKNDAEKGHFGNSIADLSTEGKKISIGTKTDSYSVSKIWLWSKKGKFTSSSNAHLEGSSPPNLDLPWMRRSEGI